jgi:hypothetical protein
MAVDILLATAGPPERVRPPRPWPRARLAAGLIMLGYLVAAVGMTWRLWARPSTTAPTAVGGNVNMDIYLSTWFMRYVAAALAHGHLPALVTTGINSPHGVNAMWNTSLLAPAFLLAPVTIIAGPVTSLTVLLTLGFAGSATSMFVALRRWQVSTAAAAFGGALFGFMPAMLVAAQDHYHLQFAVLPPLIIDAVLMLVTGRGRPVRTGLWLGLLVSLQLFTAEELLVDTAIAGTVIVLLLVLSRPREAPDRLLPTLQGAGTALAVTLMVCGRALWVQFHGPLAEHGSPWNVFAYGYPPSAYVTAPNAVLLHSNFALYLATTGQHPIEEFGYLGWPLQIALIALPFIFWRDIRIRVIGLAVLLMEWLAIGGHSVPFAGRISVPDWLLPWHYLQHLPILNQLIVVRLSIVSDGIAAVVLTLAADRALAAIRGQQHSRRLALACVTAAGLVAIVVPIIPRPVSAHQISLPPPGWTSVISSLHLPAGAPVLVLPLDRAVEMEFQAVTGEPISTTGGYCIAPDPAGQARKCESRSLQTGPERALARRSDWLAEPQGGPGPSFPTTAQALEQWRPGAVVILMANRPALRDFMISFFGPPTATRGDVMGWRTTGRYLDQLPADILARRNAHRVSAAQAAAEHRQQKVRRLA